MVADGSSVDFDTFASNIASNPNTYSDYTITLKSTVDHLSDFAPLVATDPSAPDTPTGLAASASTSGTPTVTLTWNANTEGDLAGYYIYRSTDGGSTYPLLVDAGNVVTYSDSSSLSADTTYYYKISAYDTAGNESAASSAVSATPTRPAAAAESTILAGGGGGGAGVEPQEEETTTEEAVEEEVVEEEAVPEEPAEEVPVSQMTIEQLREKIAEIQAKIQMLLVELAKLRGETGIAGIPSTFSFTRNLQLGMTGEDVKYLQIVLNSDPDTQLASTGVGSPGNETTYFGPITKSAVIKFQEKYAKVLAPWGFTAGTGYVAKTTRAKLNSLLGR